MRKAIGISLVCIAALSVAVPVVIALGPVHVLASIVIGFILFILVCAGLYLTLTDNQP